MNLLVSWNVGESCKTKKLCVGLYGHKELVMCFTWIFYKLFCFAAWTGHHAKERLWCYTVWNLPVLQASCYQGHVWAYFHDCSSKGDVCTLLVYVIGFLILCLVFTLINLWHLSFHSCDYEEYCVLVCDAVYSSRYLPTFQRTC